MNGDLGKHATAAARRERFIALAELRWGAQWQSDAARRIGCNVRTVQRWVSCDVPVPPGALADLECAIYHDAQKMLRAVEEAVDTSAGAS